MHRRCSNVKYHDYLSYGGRGISVVPDWDDFVVFLAHMGECPDGYQLDRINNDGNYEPGNCRWVTRQENTNNRRVTTVLTIDGVSKPLTMWAEEYGISYKLVASRIRDWQWSHEDAVKTAPGSKKRFSLCRE